MMFESSGLVDHKSVKLIEEVSWTFREPLGCVVINNVHIGIDFEGFFSNVGCGD
jgi:hypothetical protein